MSETDRLYRGFSKATGLFGLLIVFCVVVLNLYLAPNQSLRSYLSFIRASSSIERAATEISFKASSSSFHQFNQSKQVYLPNSRQVLIIDVVSVGSNTRRAYQDAQQHTFGSSVRHFFRITEDDDVDQACHLNLTELDAYEISSFCRHRRWGKGRDVMRYMRRTYAGVGWLNKKANPAGWMCAQRRSVHGFAKAVHFYRDDEKSLPDFLIIMDDDTYYNMDLVSTHLATMPKNEALAISGCIFRIPIHEVNFTFPFGGWGLIYSREAVRNLMRPIRCDNPNVADSFSQGSCDALKSDQILERQVFQDGMSLTDLMNAYASWQPYSEYRNWSKGKGFCLHGDWLWGYFTNFYPVSVHDPDPLFQNVAHARLQAYNGAINFSNQPDPRNIFAGGQCNRSCTLESHICHYQTPRMMVRWKTTFESLMRAPPAATKNSLSCLVQLSLVLKRMVWSEGSEACYLTCCSDKAEQMA